MKETKLMIPRRNGKELVAVYYESEKNGNTNNDNLNEKPPFVILSHGFAGDKSEDNRFPEMARALNEKGIDAVCFDFAGYGENEREPIYLQKQIENVQDVINWAKSLGYSNFGTLGLSFGGQTMLLTEIPERKVAVFWAPAFYMHRVATPFMKWIANIWYAIIKKPVKFANHEHPKVITDKRFTDQIFAQSTKKIDAKLSNFTVPALVLQGTVDPVVKRWHSKHAFSVMPHDENHRLEYIKWAGHNFKGSQRKQFIELSTEWFEKYLKN